MGLKAVVILFIFGASIASGQFMPKLLRPTPYDMSVMPYLRSNGCPSAPELAPVICQFMGHQMGFFKPQLIVPSTYIPPLVVEKCDKPQLEIELPPKKPIVIPEAPILPPITIPKFPVPVIKPLPPVPIVEPCEPAPFVVTSGAADVTVTGLNIPTAPLSTPLEIPVFPEIVEVHRGDISEVVINDQPLVVPHPPIVPGLVMPELPAVPAMMAPCPEDEPIRVPIPEFVQPLAPIPSAPELPPVRLPEVPLHVEIPPQPMVPPMIIEQVVPPMIVPYPKDEPIRVSIPDFIQPLAPIPAAPELPPVRLPEVPLHVESPPQPMVPPMIIEQVVPPMIVPCPEDEPIPVPIPDFIQPLAPIPAAPELPPVRLPEIPLHVDIPPQPIAPPMVIEHIEEPCITGEIVHRNPVIIAQPPRIPAPIPIFPAHDPAIIADPCEPAIQPVMNRPLTYFVRPLPPYTSAQAAGPVLFPARGMIPYIHRI